MATRNVFANIGADDSDDEPIEKKPLNKTQAKKEERKVEAKPLKINANKMAEGGFEVTMENAKDGKGPQRGGDRPQTGRGRGEGGPRGRGERGNRGDRGGPRGRGGPRPRTGVTRVGADGEVVVELDKRPREGFQGKTRGDHPYDKHSGAGRGTRKPADRKGGHGKGNWGDRPDAAHKRGTAGAEGEQQDPAQAADASALAGEKPAKAEKVEEEKVPEPENVVEEIIGVSLDDFLKTKTFKGKAQARQSEGIKDAKVLDGEKALARPKDKAATLLAAKDVKHDGGRVAGHELLGFQAGGDDEEAIPSRGGRGGRRGGRGGA